MEEDVKYEDYDDAKCFNFSLEFKEFEVFLASWDKWNPCQVYVMTV